MIWKYVAIAIAITVTTISAIAITAIIIMAIITADLKILVEFAFVIIMADVVYKVSVKSEDDNHGK